MLNKLNFISHLDHVDAMNYVSKGQKSMVNTNINTATAVEIITTNRTPKSNAIKFNQSK
jgi:hypothetical protein